MLEGTLIGRCIARHRHQEFIRFLNAIERTVPAGKVVHVILDNYATYKHPKVKAWLARHRRFVFHFTPTSGSWLDAVETSFATPTRRRLKRGVFRSIVDLQATTNRFIESHNHDPKPVVRTAAPDRILASVRGGHQTLETIHSVRPHSALGWLPLVQGSRQKIHPSLAAHAALRRFRRSQVTEKGELSERVCALAPEVVIPLHSRPTMH